MNNKKFRVWDHLEKRFTYPDKGYQGHYVLGLNGNFHNLQNGSGGSECEVQQFLGRLDKNMKEIYEGDVVSINNSEEIGLVEYSSDHCSYIVSKDISFDLFFTLDLEKIEVVGNIKEDYYWDETGSLERKRS